jgi:hypothetical protein
VDLVVYDDDEHRYVPWAVALSALAVVAVLAAGAAFLVGRQSAEDAAVSGIDVPQAATAPTPSEEPVVAPSVPPVPADPETSPPAAASTSTPACAQALLQADAALERSVAIEEALAEHTRVMDELLAQRISPEQALDEVLPVLTGAATDRKRFREQVVEFEGTRENCPL